MSYGFLKKGLSLNFTFNIKRLFNELIKFYPTCNHLKAYGFLLILEGIKIKLIHLNLPNIWSEIGHHP